MQTPSTRALWTVSSYITPFDSLDQRRHVMWLMCLAAQCRDPEGASRLQQAHLQKQKSEEIWPDTIVMWCIKRKPLKGFSNLQGTLWEHSAASGQLFVFACCFLHNPRRTAGWERNGKAQRRTQSWAAGTDFCAPERQNTFVELSSKMPRRRQTHTVALDSSSHLPVLIQLEEGLVLSGAQHQEVDEQEHAEWIRVWIQTKKKQETWTADYLKF